MNSSIILWALPFYLLVIAFELGISLWKNRKLYDLNEALSNVACGVVQQISDATINLAVIPFYLLLQKKHGLITMEQNWPVLIALFITKDFLYYWFHRLSHTVGFFWGIHLVHHQSRVYNYTVGLRMPLFHYVLDIFQVMILALIGFPVEGFIVVSFVWASLQILTHTTMVKKEIPVLRWIFVTPSHHRVHHGMNDPYINKNYGGIFSFWDRVFGSYQPEIEETPVIFGVRDEHYSLNPIMANLIYYTTLPDRLAAHKDLGRKSLVAVSVILLALSGIFISRAKYLPLILSLAISAALFVLYFMLGKSYEKRITPETFQNQEHSPL